MLPLPCRLQGKTYHQICTLPSSHSRWLSINHYLTSVAKGFFSFWCIKSFYFFVYFCSCWRGIAVSSCPSVGPSVKRLEAWHILWTVHARVFEISYMDSSWKNSWHTSFFLSELSPFLELCPFVRIRMESDACHILWTMHARVLKFHNYMNSSWQNCWLVLLSCPSYLPFCSYALWKNRNTILSAKYLEKYWGRDSNLYQLIEDDK